MRKKLTLVLLNSAAIHDAKEARVRVATMENPITKKLDGGFSMAARRSKKWD